jgi:hypothetical protein
MSVVLPKDLLPGMKLAKPLVNRSGLVMIGEETELTSSLIDKIRTLDVESIHVHGAVSALPPRDEVLAELDRRFRKVESQPFMAGIKAAISEHIESLYREHGPEDIKG